MQGSMRQRSAGSWELRVFVGVDPETKRRRYRSVTVRGSRADAQRELDVMVASTRSVREVGLRSSMSELLEAWFSIAATSWAPTTVRQTRSALKCYLHPRIGDVAVGDLTPAAIDAMYAALHRGGGMRGQPLAAGTLARVHVVLRASLAQAVRWGWIWDNPAARAHRIVSVAPELSPPTPDEVRVLLDHVHSRDLALHTFVVVAAFSGGRRSQLLGLRWRNVDFDHGRLSFCAGWVEGPEGPVLTATKTKRRHVVDLDAGSVAVLVEHAQRCRSSNGEVLNPDGFLFSDDADGAAAWKPNRATKAFGRLRRDAGLRQFRLHDLRHFMATQMLEAGVALPVVSRRVDHRRVSTTLDRYAHAVPGGDAAAAQTLWRIVQQAS
ncbi:MAG TPA: site-specific integrase [Ilumatobacter sp.]|nr:site-specific integrase [Ilumatobacter sp.]